TKDNIIVGQAEKKKEPKQEYILIPICITDPLISQGPKDSAMDAGKKATEVDASQVSDNDGSPVSIVGPSFVNAALPSPINAAETPVPIVTLINDTRIFGNAYDDEAIEEEVDMNKTLVDLPKDKWAIGTEWVFRNKKDERDIVIKNKARLVAQGHTQEEVQQKSDGIFISQDKYVAAILNFFSFSTVKRASTPMEPNKALVKDVEAKDVDVHLYRSMIRSLMYLTASRPDITFAVCAYARNFTTGGCQFLGKRLISWQCKKKTIVANSTTKAEYVAATSCCG
nr:hypothetical protein [Tanacetum cinerariifolium]